MVKKKTSAARSNILKWLLESKTGVLLSNYIFQGILYMEKTEFLFKICFELIVFVFLFLLFATLITTTAYSFVLALVLAHTCNWLFNGHLFVLGRYLGFTRNSPVRFIDYPEGIRQRLSKRTSIQAVAFFGSLSRNGFSTNSDLDVRVVSEVNGRSNFAACFWTFLERSVALFNKYPLDVYVISKKESLLKLREDEYPVVLFDKTGYFASFYGTFREYSDFRKDFLKKYVAQE
jgi:predicted nucleotidyltransferase